MAEAELEKRSKCGVAEVGKRECRWGVAWQAG